MAILQRKEGQAIESWINFNFFDNQLSVYINDDFHELDYCEKETGISVPISCFGC